MKNIIFISLFLFSVSFGQYENNLLSNPSFETFTGTEDDDTQDSDDSRAIGGGTVPESDIRLENGVWTN